MGYTRPAYASESAARAGARIGTTASLASAVPAFVVGPMLIALGYGTIARILSIAIMGGLTWFVMERWLALPGVRHYWAPKGGQRAAQVVTAIIALLSFSALGTLAFAVLIGGLLSLYLPSQIAEETPVSTRLSFILSVIGPFVGGMFVTFLARRLFPVLVLEVGFERATVSLAITGVAVAFILPFTFRFAAHLDATLAAVNAAMDAEGYPKAAD